MYFFASFTQLNYFEIHSNFYMNQGFMLSRIPHPLYG